VSTIPTNSALPPSPPSGGVLPAPFLPPATLHADVCLGPRLLMPPPPPPPPWLPRRKIEQMSPSIAVWQFDFQPVMMTAPRSFCTIGFSVRLPPEDATTTSVRGQVAAERLVCMSFSVDHAGKQPDLEKKGGVWADLGVAGYLIEQLPAEALPEGVGARCKVTCIMRLDISPLGDMLWVIRTKGAADQPGSFRALSKALAAAGPAPPPDMGPAQQADAWAGLDALAGALLEGGPDGACEGAGSEPWVPEPQAAASGGVASFFGWK
jgi:hypothetical protein